MKYEMNESQNKQMAKADKKREKAKMIQIIETFVGFSILNYNLFAFFSPTSML